MPFRGTTTLLLSAYILGTLRKLLLDSSELIWWTIRSTESVNMSSKMSLPDMSKAQMPRSDAIYSSIYC